MTDLHPFRVGTFIATDETRTVFRTVSQQIPDSSFPALLTAITNSLVGKITKDSTDLSSHPSLAKLNNPVLANSILRILQAYFIDFAKCGTPGTSVRSSLEEAGLSTNKVNNMVEIYEQSMQNIRNALQNSGIALPQLVDLTWRLDYLVSTKETGKIGKPVYRIKMVFAVPTVLPSSATPLLSPLNLTDNGNNSTVTASGTSTLQELVFGCSPQELEDLLSKLKDGVRTAQNLLQPPTPSSSKTGNI